MLYGKNLICTSDWNLDELKLILKTAVAMKNDRFNKKWFTILQNKSFLMLFCSPSLRTHLSFTAAVSELGGHSEYLDPGNMTKIKTKNSPGECIEDAAQIMSLYMAGIGIRAMESALSYYGEGHNLIKEYAKYAKVPVINMADDVCHPCQSLADMMGWAEWFSPLKNKVDFNTLKNKNLLVTWAKGSLARSWNSPQGSLLLASRFGLNITIARPEGYDMDEKIYEQIKQNCKNCESSFQLIDDPAKGYEGADIVYSRNWISPMAYQNGVFNKEREVNAALQYQDWITTEKKMRTTNNAIFTHPMPIDRGYEVEDSVASGKNSVIYNVASNRLHVQKAILAHTLGTIPDEKE